MRSVRRVLLRQRPTLSFILVFVAIGAGVGCGDDDDDSADVATTERSGVVAEASDMIEEARKPLEFEPPGEPIDVSELKGQTVALILVDQEIPVLAAAAAESAKAAETQGVKTTLFDAQGEVPRMGQGIDQAIQNADAIVLFGIPIAVVEAQLKRADDADLPVVNSLNNQPEPDAPGQGAGPLVDAAAAPDYRQVGALEAAKAVVDTDGQAKVMIITDKVVTPAAPTVEGMKSFLSKCSGCEVVVEKSIPFVEWTTKVGPEVQSAIRSNPDLNYILPIFDQVSLFATPAIEQAGAGDRVRNASANGSPAALELLLSSDVFTADIGYDPNWLAWLTMDQAFRGMLGKSPSDPAVPVRYLDDENLEGVDVHDLDEPYGDNLGFREGFQQLWSGG